MRIGFANIFSFRPHVEHLYYLSDVLKRGGHETFFLTCDASVSNCYSRAIKGTSKLKECPKCIIGGVRTFPVSNITHIKGGLKGNLSAAELDDMTVSSASTLHRTEIPEHKQTGAFRATQESLKTPVDVVHANALKWIDDNRLQAVICFNGRMELTRAITYACEKRGIPFITQERTWFGDGIRMVPNENCLSIKDVDALNRQFRDVPLTREQSMYAGRLAAERFLQRNTLEWRLYNPDPEKTSWPLKTEGMKVLVLPSSKNEFEGHPEWVSEWGNNTVVLDKLFEKLGVDPNQVVLRCHPNWAENIGQVTGNNSRNTYTQWAKARGIYFIDSDQKASTYDLTLETDLVVVNGSSSAVEAGVCGKKIVCLGHSGYQEAGFTVQVHTSDDWSKLSALDHHDELMTVRKTLRYLYVRARRFAQFNDYVKAIKTTHYEYYEGADSERLIQMFETGIVEADDPVCAETDVDETPVAKALLARQWEDLMLDDVKASVGKRVDIGRRPALRWIDQMRSKMPLGDRA